MLTIQEFQIQTEHSRLAEMGVKSLMTAKLAIDILEIDSIWENEHEDTGEKGTTICLKSGTEYVVLDKYEVVLAIWKKYVEHKS